LNVFRYAPKPTAVSGLTAVPMHIDLVTATMVFNAPAKTAHCNAEMQFTMGPASGHPFFDLRQTIDTASLDGLPFAIAKLAHHDFGGGPNTQLRIIEQWLSMGSAHTLALSYNLDTPASPNAQGIGWDPGSTRVSFDFYLSDLNPARYLESWLPSNLLFDRFPVNLEVQIIDSGFNHVLMSNGAVTDLGSNHWRVDFPASFAPCSPMLLIKAADRVELYSTATTLTGGVNVTLELMKAASDAALDLPSAAITLAGYLDGFHSSEGPYMHGSRFVAFLTSGPTHSMEYNGGTTSWMSVLMHEVFHSWWARGMVPARGEDGWLDEAWTTYRTQAGGPDAVPFDLSDPPITLWTDNAFGRNTPIASYSLGSAFFSGLASELGIATLQSHMSGIYQDAVDRRFATPEIEADLIRRSGQLQLARYFDRFVYGFGDLPAGAQPDLYLRDATDDTGDTPYSGTFWNSPDVWVRNLDDDGATHQNPEHGQDNWLYARVHNRGNATARSFVVGFKINTWAGTQFVYPGDWFPLTAATVGFDLLPFSSRVVKARWPQEDVPPVGTHGCLLAVVYNPDDPLAPGVHVWEDNNLAQRNLTIVDLVPNGTAEIPLWIGSRFAWQAQFHVVELVRGRAWPDLEVSLTHPRPEVVEDLFYSFDRLKKVMRVEQRPAIDMTAPLEIQLCGGAATLRPSHGSKLRLGTGLRRLDRLSSQAELVDLGEVGRAIRFDPGRRAALPIALRPGERWNTVLRLTAPPSAKPGETFVVDIVQREADGRAVGGVSVQINIAREKEEVHECTCDLL
jgi:hypothetical protein